MNGQTRQHHRSSHPHRVAELAARIARRFARDIRSRPVMLAALAPYLRRGDFAGAHFADALAAWAADVAWVREPADVGELIASPWRTAAMMAGDCDDVAAAVAGFAALAGAASAVAVYYTGPASAHVGAIVSRDTAAGPLAVWIDQHGQATWPSSTHLDPKNAARVFLVRPPG